MAGIETRSLEEAFSIVHAASEATWALYKPFGIVGLQVIDRSITRYVSSNRENDFVRVFGRIYSVLTSEYRKENKYQYGA